MEEFESLAAFLEHVALVMENQNNNAAAGRSPSMTAWREGA